MKRFPTEQEKADDAKAYAGYPEKPVECIALTHDGMIDESMAAWGLWFPSNKSESRRLDTQGYLYRPKPEPVTRDWNQPEDVPLDCWLHTNMAAYLVIAVCDDGVITGGSRQELRKWKDIKTMYAGYSTDRKTIMPCKVTEG